MKINKNIFLIFLCMFGFINVVNAETNYSYFTIDNVNDIETLQYNNNILSEFQTMDNNDKIVSTEILLSNDNTNNSAILIEYDNGYSAFIKITKYSAFGQNLFMIVRQTVSNKYNSTCCILYNNSDIVSMVLRKKLKIVTDYNFESGVSGIETYSGISSSLHYYGNFSLGTSNLKVSGLSPFDIKITVSDIGRKILREQNYNSLSGLSQFIYNTLTVKIPYTNVRISGNSDILLSLLRFFDLFFYMFYILFYTVFNYPYMVAVWILTIGNFIVSWKSTTLREILFNYSDYFKFIGDKFYTLFTYIYTTIINLINAIW